MDNYPTNSHKSKSETSEANNTKRIERITSSRVTRKKKTLGRKFVETFVGGDASGVWQYVLMDVLIPAAKDVIIDALTQGIERTFYGEGRPGNYRRNGYRPPNSHTSYNRYSSPNSSNWSPNRDRRRNFELSRRDRSSHNFDEIILASRPEAEAVLRRMYDLLSEYDCVSVADFYEVVGLDSTDVDEKWGWTDLHGSSVRRVRDGEYRVNLPKTEYLGE